MNRRAFWQRLGALGAGVACAAHARASQPSDAPHKVRGWMVRWSGWREPVNQTVKLGFWMALRAGDNQHVMTTTGAYSRIPAYNTIDTTVHEGWPCAATATDEEFNAAKWRAYRALVEKL